MQHRGVKAGKPSARVAVVAAALLMVLCAIGIKQFLKSPADSAAAEAVQPPAPADGADAQQGPLPRYEVDWDLALARDPFSSSLVFQGKAPVTLNPDGHRPEKAEEITQAARRTLKLNGIFLGSRPLAIINGKTFRKGDRVEGYVVQEIGAKEVVVEKDGVQVGLVREQGDLGR